MPALLLSKNTVAFINGLVFVDKAHIVLRPASKWHIFFGTSGDCADPLVMKQRS
jgi:hypothetical protein